MNAATNDSELGDDNEQASTSTHIASTERDHTLQEENETGFPKGKTPRKRRLYGKQDKAFAEEEKKKLRFYEDIESKTRQNIMKVYNKFNEFQIQDRIKTKISFIIKKLKALEEKRSLDPVYIGLFGSTGAGKSSLLNAIVKKEFFLPVSGENACTACVTEVKKECRAKTYKAKIKLLTMQEWHRELEILIELCNCRDDNDESEDVEDDDDDDLDAVTIARKKIKTLYGESALKLSYNEIKRLKINFPKHCNRDVIALSENDEKSFCEKLRPYIKAGNYEEKTDKLWPLVKYVEVTIPDSDVLPEGVILLDIPGTGDANTERDAMWKKYINECSVIWIISSWERAMGKNSDLDILKESISALSGGMCSEIILVVTKSDDIKLEEFNRNQQHGKNQFTSINDAIIESNKTKKIKETKRITKMLKRKLPNYEIRDKTDLVYTVSAKAYWDKEKGRTTNLTAEETEIPELREYIRNICLRQKKKMIEEYVKECFGILAFIQIFSSEKNTQETDGNYSHLKTILGEQLKYLEERISKNFDEMEKPLSEGVADAEKSYKKNRKTVLCSITGSNQGFHKQLRAMCLNNGLHVSSIVRYDLNLTLAEPIYERINNSFRNKFRIDHETRSALKSDLTAFQTKIKEEIHNVLKAKREDKNTMHKQNVLNKMIDAIFVGIQRLITEEKEKIYKSLWISIQNDLKPKYKEAANIRGKDSCKQMQIILETATDTLSKNMFKNAKEAMKEEFSNLKGKIIQLLKTDISTTLELALCLHELDTFQLPDISEQYKEVEDIYSKLF
ncbi:nuclear GTPase SLIP-GC [Rhinatrema bivittatum]|uniref:nuclear GTPase SLIP-GC n=1 Tax=Rhinatrema bivittatum TaxID=194408 RepID=UPI00112C3128|nr:nuclear GTPase SLIP-GC [Rhinatrema bivittatum]